MNDSFSGVGGVGQRTARIAGPLERFGADRMERAAADDAGGSALTRPAPSVYAAVTLFLSPIARAPMDDLGA